VTSSVGDVLISWLTEIFLKFMELQTCMKTVAWRVAGVHMCPSKQRLLLGMWPSSNKSIDDQQSILCFWFFFEGVSVCRAPVLLKLGFPVISGWYNCWKHGKIPIGARLLECPKASYTMGEANRGISCASQGLCGWKRSQLQILITALHFMGESFIL